MQFYIGVRNATKTRMTGEIRIDDFVETFQMAIVYWKAADYKNQWEEGLRRVLSGKDSALITSITKPESATYLEWWPLYLSGSQVIIHNQLLFMDQLKKEFTIDDPYSHVPPYFKCNEDGDAISEWIAPRSAVESFLVDNC